MSQDALAYWPTWRNKLIEELRRRQIPGGKIGDILLETDYHVKDSGESPETAFGDPSDYARQRASMLGTADDKLGTGDASWWLIGLYVASGLGGILAAVAAWNIGAGTATWAGIIPTWLTLLVGLVLMAGSLYLIGTDRITDPRTGRPLLAAHQSLNPVEGFAFGLGPVILVAILAWVFAR